MFWNILGDLGCMVVAILFVCMPVFHALKYAYLFMNDACKLQYSFS